VLDLRRNFAFADDTRTLNEVVCILVIRGIKFNISWHYAEWNLAYTEIWGTKFSAYWDAQVYVWFQEKLALADNTQNEIVSILIICGEKNFRMLIICRMKLPVCWDYAECTEIWISWRIWSQNRKYGKYSYFRWLVRSSDGFFWPNQFKTKKSHTSVPLKGVIFYIVLIVYSNICELF
jgi:hypothetical protein